MNGSGERPDQELEALVRAVQRSAKYRTVAPELVRHIGARELAHRHSLREAIKATKNKLHQVAAAYMTARPRYEEWLARLREAASDQAALRAAARQIMAAHASTRERLPILDEFYRETLQEIGPVRSVIDVACGLNPLAIPWMPLASVARYAAFDMYTDLAWFLGQAIPLLGAQGTAYAVDVLQHDFAEPADLALLMKAIPCLEQIDEEGTERLLDRLPARHLLITFPVHSLGGHPRGMIQHYSQRFEHIAAQRGWDLRRWTFATELAYLVTR